MKYPSYSTKTVYPQDIECVLQSQKGKGGIYIGNLQASQNLSTLKKHNIKAVLTAARDIRFNHPKSQIPYHLHIPGQDHENFDLTRYFEKSIDFIHQTLKQTNILVHCMAGISRSVTLVLAYLMKHHEMSYEQAFQAVRRRRRIINPNRGFIKQLKQYQKTLQAQKQGMRRSVDNFQYRTEYESRKQIPQSPTKARQYLHQSIHRNNSNNLTQTYNRYLTIPYNNQQDNEQNSINKYTFNTKYQIPTNHNHKRTNNYISYNNLNKQLDEKIANIRKKYMEATDLLNRQQKKYKTDTNYFKQGFKTIADTSLEQNKGYPGLGYNTMLKRTPTAANQYRRNIRNNSTYNYANKTQGYMYYNY